MALSATLSPHVLRYTQRVLNVNTPTGVIKRSIDRPNIYLHCIPIRHGVSSRKNLLFLVPQELSPDDIALLPKTMLFIDSRVAVCETATMLIHRLPQQFRNTDVICDNSTALSEQRRAVIMERFILGTCRILVCTEAAGMRVDVSDVVRVIQWTIPRHVNLASFWQRAGRCGQNWEISRIAILFYNKAQRIPTDTGHPLEIFCEPGTGGKVDQVLDHIRAFDSGEFSNRKKGTETSNAPQPPVFEQEFVESALAELRVETTERVLYSSEGTSAHPPVEHTQLQQCAKLTGPGLKAFATLDRGILWFLSTTGCRRLTVRYYFDDTNISPYLPPSATQNSSTIGSAHTTSAQYDLLSGPCCDNCVSGNLDLLPMAIASLLPHPSSYMDTIIPDASGPGLCAIDLEDEVEDSNTQPASRRTRVSSSTKTLLSLKLQRFHEDVWIREGLNQWMGMFGSSFFLPDKHLQCLVQRCVSIEDMNSLAQALARNKIDLQFSAIGPYAQELLELIISTVQTSDPSASFFPEDIPEFADSGAPGRQLHATENFTRRLSHTEDVISTALTVPDRDSVPPPGPRPRP